MKKVAVALELDARNLRKLETRSRQIRSTLGKQTLHISAKTNFGVGGNTYRAMGKGAKHSFDEWARRQTERIVTDPRGFAARIATPAQFRAWHRTTEKGIRKRFTRSGVRFAYAHPLKLLDLYVKWLTKLDLGSRRLTMRLVRHGNCALDRHTLDAMNKALSNMFPMRAPSMGMVKGRAAYDFCEDLIGRIAAAANSTPVLADFVWWPDKKRRTNKD
jgi:hypothetical protein